MEDERALASSRQRSPLWGVRWGLESLGSHLVVLTSPQGHLEATEGFKQGKARSDGHFLKIPCTVREQTGLKACRPEEAGEVVQAGGSGVWVERNGGSERGRGGGFTVLGHQLDVGAMDKPEGGVWDDVLLTF